MTRPSSTAPASSIRLAWLLLTAGLTGFSAAFVLLLEKLALLRDADYTPTCSLNPVLNCGSVMRTEQAEVLGFPNPLLGIAGFAVVATTGAVLLAGARLSRWFWLALQAGVTVGVGFVGWLAFQSIYRINALCPYCLVVWIAMVPTFWFVTLHNARTGALGRAVASSRALRVVREWHGTALTALTLIVLGAIAQRFWDYWSTVL